MKKWLILIVFLCAHTLAFSEPVNDLYPFESKAQTAQFEHLLTSLRCLVCQNQNLADSHAPLAKDLKHKVYELVKQGQSDDQIMHYMTQRYGDFVLFKPPMTWLTYFLWFGPLLFLMLGFLIYWRSCYSPARETI